jgi:hypothetical protein
LQVYAVMSIAAIKKRSKINWVKGLPAIPNKGKPSLCIYICEGKTGVLR